MSHNLNLRIAFIWNKIFFSYFNLISSEIKGKGKTFILIEENEEIKLGFFNFFLVRIN